MSGANAALRFGIVGAGGIAATHAAALAASERAELVAASGGSRAAAFAAEHDCRYHDDPADLIAAPDVDALLLATPSGARLEWIERAAASGVHVLSEKPLEVTAERCDAAIAACHAAGVALGAIFQSRARPAYRALKRAIGAGALGDIVLASASLRWFRPPEYYADSSWRGTRALDGGGALMNQGIHSLDLLLWLAGDLAATSAAATRRKHHGIEVEDTLAATLEFASGALGVFEATTAAHPPEPRRLAIHGTEGAAVFVGDEPVAWEVPGAPRPATDGAGEGSSDPTVADARWHRIQIDAFVDAVRAGRAPELDGREGARAVRAARAIYAAAERGERVEVDR